MNGRQKVDYEKSLSYLPEEMKRRMEGNFKLAMESSGQSVPSLEGMWTVSEEAPKSDAKLLGKAKAHVPLTAEDVSELQTLLSGDEGGGFRSESSKEELEELLASIKGQMSAALFERNAVRNVLLLADFLYSFLHLKPFESNNMSVAVCLADCVAVWCDFPPIRFDEKRIMKMKNAARDLNALRLEIAGWYRETIYHYDGTVFNAVSEDRLNTDYVDKEGKEYIVQWNTLVAAEAGWTSGTRPTLP